MLNRNDLRVEFLQSRARDLLLVLFSTRNSRCFAPLGMTDAFLHQPANGLSEIGIVLSDSGQLARVFNNLLGLLLKQFSSGAKGVCVCLLLPKRQRMAQSAWCVVLCQRSTLRILDRSRSRELNHSGSRELNHSECKGHSGFVLNLRTCRTPDPSPS